MKKEKKVRTYQRRTKSGKMVTVKAHTAKYDAAEKAMEMAKKKGAGKELEERRKQPVQLEIPFEDGDEKKILDEVKEKEKSNGKKTTKKETEEKKPRKKRTVGTGTNGPESKKSTSRKISSDLVKKYAASEDIDTKTARRELKEMTDKEFNKVQKYHDKESTPKRMSERSLEKLSGKISKKDFFAGKTSSKKKSNKADSTKTAPKERWTVSSELKSHFDTMNEYKKATMEAIKTGDPKKIRQARNSYNLAFTRYGDIASKKDRVSAEKEYSKVIAALNKAGYDEFGYKKRVSSKSEPTEKKSSGRGTISVAEMKSRSMETHAKGVKDYASLKKAGWKSKSIDGRRYLISPDGKKQVEYTVHKDKPWLPAVYSIGSSGPKPRKTEKATSISSKPTSKELKQQYEEALASERKSEIRNNRNANKALYEKYGVTHKEVSDFMKSSKRKWRWDRETNSFTTAYMPDGKSKMRGISKLSLESALKRYAKTK